MMHRRVFPLVTLLAIFFCTNIFASTEIVEWAPFTIKKGVSNEKLRRAAQSVEVGFLAKQEGYIKRSLLKGTDGQWVDIVYWESKELANAASLKAYESPVCFEYFSLMQNMDHSEVSNVQHYEIVKSWH